MTLLEYIRDFAPKYCGVHPSCGKTAEMVYNAEVAGSPEFAQGQFATTRERAEMAMPYQCGIEREHVLDVIELAICSHRQAAHGEDHSIRISALKTQPMTAEELEVGTRDWWNQ